MNGPAHVLNPSVVIEGGPAPPVPVDVVIDEDQGPVTRLWLYGVPRRDDYLVEYGVVYRVEWGDDGVARVFVR